jgi:hypothetical protein
MSFIVVFEIVYFIYNIHIFQAIKFGLDKGVNRRRKNVVYLNSINLFVIYYLPNSSNE